MTLAEIRAAAQSDGSRLWTFSRGVRRRTMVRDSRTRGPFARRVALGLIVLTVLGAAARAQQGMVPGANARKAGPPAARQPGGATFGDPFLPSEGPSVLAKADRAQVQLLGLARQLVERGRYAEAVRALGAILDSPEDNFLPERSGPVQRRSLKSEAQQMLGRMPAAGTDLYELQFGAAPADARRGHRRRQRLRADRGLAAVLSYAGRL